MLRSLLTRAVLVAAFVALAGPAGAQGSLGTFASDLDGPFRLAQRADGTVLVTEGRGQRLVQFSSTGTDRTVLATFPGPPSGLAVPSGGGVLVGDRINTQTQGTVGRILSLAEGQDTELLASGVGIPRDIIEVGDNFLVVDGSSQGRVVQVSADGSTQSDLITGLSSPGGIVRLADGRLLVTDGGTGRVLAYNADGTGETVFASGLGAPNDITQVADGRVLVVNSDDDSSNDATDEDAADGDVAIFAADGTRLGTLADDLVRPTGVLQLADGRVLVAEFNGAASAGAIGTVEAYGLPTSSEPGGPALATVGVPTPNPAAGASALDVSVVEGQRVRVSVYDVLGREVAVAFDGPLVAGASMPVALDAERLAPGTYVVRVAGETFAEARRLTVAR